MMELYGIAVFSRMELWLVIDDSCRIARPSSPAAEPFERRLAGRLQGLKPLGFRIMRAGRVCQWATRKCHHEGPAMTHAMEQQCSGNVPSQSDDPSPKTPVSLNYLSKTN